MNRIGVRAEDAAPFARNLADFPGLKLEGTFTHLATADVAGDWEVTRQLAALRKCARRDAHRRRRTRASCTRRTAPRRSCIRRRTTTWCAAESRSTDCSPAPTPSSVIELAAGDVGQGARDARQAHRHGRQRQLRLHVDGRAPTDDRDASARLRRWRAPRAVQRDGAFSSAGSGVGRSGACAWTSSWSRSPRGVSATRRRGRHRRRAGWRADAHGDDLPSRPAPSTTSSPARSAAASCASTAVGPWARMGSRRREPGRMSS